MMSIAICWHVPFVGLNIQAGEQGENLENIDGSFHA